MYLSDIRRIEKYLEQLRSTVCYESRRENHTPEENEILLNMEQQISQLEGQVLDLRIRSNSYSGKLVHWLKTNWLNNLPVRNLTDIKMQVVREGSIKLLIDLRFLGFTGELYHYGNQPRTPAQEFRMAVENGPVIGRLNSFHPKFTVSVINNLYYYGNVLAFEVNFAKSLTNSANLEPLMQDFVRELNELIRQTQLNNQALQEIA